jgi:hypothetical protein
MIGISSHSSSSSKRSKSTDSQFTDKSAKHEFGFSFEGDVLRFTPAVGSKQGCADTSKNPTPAVKVSSPKYVRYVEKEDVLEYAIRGYESPFTLRCWSKFRSDLVPLRKVAVEGLPETSNSGSDKPGCGSKNIGDVSTGENNSGSGEHEDLKGSTLDVLMHEYCDKIGSFDSDLRDGTWDVFDMSENDCMMPEYFTEKMARDRSRRHLVPYNFTLNKLSYGGAPYHKCNKIRRVSVMKYKEEYSHKKAVLSTIAKALKNNYHLYALVRMDMFKVDGFDYLLLVWYFDMYDQGWARKVFSRPIWAYKHDRYIPEYLTELIDDFYLDLYDFVDAMKENKISVPEENIPELAEKIKDALDGVMENWVDPDIEKEEQKMIAKGFEKCGPYHSPYDNLIDCKFFQC